MKAIKFIFWMLVCQLPALVSASVVQNNMGWYNALNQAPLSPPNSVFGIVWGFLYVLLGLCAFLAFGNGINNKNKIAVMCFISQLALNMCWTPVFFGRQNPLGALVLLAGMLGLALFQLDLFRQLNRKAFFLFIPYTAWLCFALYLNFGVWILN